MTNKIEILTNIKCKSLFSATIPATAEYVAVCKSEQHGTGLLVYFPQTGIYSQINAGVVQSLDQEEVKKALSDAKIERIEVEPITSLISFKSPPSLKEALFKHVEHIREPGQTSHGVFSTVCREALVLYLATHKKTN
jgi:hypothetical protein